MNKKTIAVFLIGFSLIVGMTIWEKANRQPTKIINNNYSSSSSKASNTTIIAGLIHTSQMGNLKWLEISNEDLIRASGAKLHWYSFSTEKERAILRGTSITVSSLEVWQWTLTIITPNGILIPTKEKGSE
jgi:hypothetical protein